MTEFRRLDRSTISDESLLHEVFFRLCFVREHNINGEAQCADCIESVDVIADLLNQRLYNDDPGT